MISQGFVRITGSNTYRDTCEITVRYYKTYMWGFHLLPWQGQGKYGTGCGDWEQRIQRCSYFTPKVPTSALHIVKQRWHWGSKGAFLPLPLPGHIRKGISATCLLKMDREKHLTKPEGFWATLEGPSLLILSEKAFINQLIKEGRLRAISLHEKTGSQGVEVSFLLPRTEQNYIRVLQKQAFPSSLPRVNLHNLHNSASDPLQWWNAISWLLR